MRKVLCAAVLSVFMTNAGAMAQGYRYNNPYANPYNNPHAAPYYNERQHYEQMQEYNNIMREQNRIMEMQRIDQQNAETNRRWDSLLNKN